MRNSALWGRLFADNAATLDGVAWSGGSWTLPLTNLVDERIVSYPARCLITGDGAADRAAATFTLTFPQRVHVWSAYIENTLLPPRAVVRIEGNSKADWSGANVDSGWFRWNTRQVKSMALPWIAPNWWTGAATEAELTTYGRRLRFFTGERPWSVRALRLTIDPRVVVPGHLDLGYLFLPQRRWLPPYNYALGRGLEALPRDIVDETASGYRPVEPRRARRKHSISYEVLTKDGAFDLFDTGMTSTLARPVLFVPEPKDPLLHFRQTFLGKFRDSLPKAQQWEQMLWSSSLTIEEMMG